MSGRSFPSPRFPDGTPSHNQQHSNYRQPLYLPSNNAYLSPRSSRMSSPRNGSGSPDFIPLGVSSPVGRVRHSWKQRSYSNPNSSFSGYSSSGSTGSSPNFSPYRNSGGNHRGYRKDRRTGSFGSNHSGSSNISLYIDREALEDPWASLESQLSEGAFPQNVSKDFRELKDSELPVSGDEVSSDEDDDS